MAFAALTPMPLRRIAEPFHDPDWLSELKYDGFRALAQIAAGRCRLVSRNRNEFRAFAGLAEALGNAIPTPAVLDGEIVCVSTAMGSPSFISSSIAGQSRCSSRSLLFRGFPAPIFTQLSCKGRSGFVGSALLTKTLKGKLLKS
jgi:hypothetical protein